MPASALEALGGFFDRRFMIAYWAPAFVAICLVVGMLMIGLGVQRAVSWWTGTGPGQLALFGVVIVLVTSIVAYLLQPMTGRVIRAFEGYGWGPYLSQWAIQSQKRKWRKNVPIDAQRDEETVRNLDRSRYYHARYYSFPANIASLRPTRLGNILTAAEEYPTQMYSMNSVLWWPRLIVLVPDTFRTQVDDALVPLVALLNLSMIFSLVALPGGLWVGLVSQNWLLFIIVSLGAALMSWFCYRVAVSQTVSYGDLIRVAFDLYRHEILKQMQIPLPKNPTEEHELWLALSEWTYYAVLPDELSDLAYDVDALLPPQRVELEVHRKQSTPKAED